MFLYARSARRPALHPSAASLSPIFRERYLSALARVPPARANHLSIKAAERKEIGLKELSATSTIDTAGTIGTSSGELCSPFEEARAIEADIGAFGENTALPAEVNSLPSTPASDAEIASAAKYLTYPPPNRTYAAFKGLEREVEGGKDPVENVNSIPRPARPAPDTMTIEPALDIAELAPSAVEAHLDIPVDIPIEPSLPLDKDDGFTFIDHDVDTPSTPAVLIHGANVEPDDVDVLVLIPCEAEDILSEQPSVKDGGDDWVVVEA